MSTASIPRALDAQRSPFAGAEICHLAGFQLLPGSPGPVFDQEIWDFTVVVGLPVQLHPNQRRMDFTVITDSRWRLVAKELILALLAPRHPAVAMLPRAYRTPLHLTTCQVRFQELSRWLNWLTRRGVTSLQEVTEQHCEAFLAHRRQVRDRHGTVIGARSPAVGRNVALVIADLVNYRELFTTDRFRSDLRPWSGALPSAIAEMPSGQQENKTPPVGQHLLQPMLAAALYLTDTLGPHLVDLVRQLRATDRARARSQLANPRHCPTQQFTAVLHEHADCGDPLPLLLEDYARARLAAGWPPQDPLLRVNLEALAHTAGATQFRPQWIPPLRDLVQATPGQGRTRKAMGPCRCTGAPSEP